MTILQQVLTVAAVVLGTMTTRFLPFLHFPEGKQPPAFIRYLGTVLPSAVIGLLVLTGHPRTLAVTLPLLFLVFWASIAAKRHTLPQLIGGTLIPIAWCVLLSSYIVDSYR